MSPEERRPSDPILHLLGAAAIGGLCGAGFGLAVGAAVTATSGRAVAGARWFYLLTFALFGVLTAIALARRAGEHR